MGDTEEVDMDATLGPRILGKWMKHFIGKNVRLIGCKMSESTIMTVDTVQVELTKGWNPDCAPVPVGEIMMLIVL